MKFKKFLSSVLMLVLVMTTIVGTNVFADNTSHQKEFFVNQDNSVINYHKLMNDLKINTNESISTENTLIDNYGGAFIGDDGNLTVNVVGDLTDGISKFKKTISDDTVKYKKADYTLNQLKDAEKATTKILGQLDVVGTALSEIDNKVHVYVLKMDDSKINKIKKIINNPCIDFINQDALLTLTSTTVINGNKGTSNGEDFTVGFPARDSSNTLGWVIPGHISAPVGNTVFYNGSINNDMGAITKKVFSGNTDASFSAFHIGTTCAPSASFPNGDTFVDADTSLYPNGYTVDAYGQLSGKQTGSILSNSFSCTVKLPSGGTMVMTDMMQCNYMAIKGDSGAAVTIIKQAYIGGPFYRHIIGMQSSSLLVNDTTWVTGTSYSVCSKISNIQNNLGVHVVTN